MHYGYLVCSELGINIFSKLFLEYVVYINLALSRFYYSVNNHHVVTVFFFWGGGGRGAFENGERVSSLKCNVTFFSTYDSKSPKLLRV